MFEERCESVIWDGFFFFRLTHPAHPVDKHFSTLGIISRYKGIETERALLVTLNHLSDPFGTICFVKYAFDLFVKDTVSNPSVSSCETVSGRSCQCAPVKAPGLNKNCRKMIWSACHLLSNGSFRVTERDAPGGH